MSNNSENELNILDEINKGATMGMDAINDIKPKVEDKRFMQVLDTEYSKYNHISQRVNEIYDNYSSKDPHTPNEMEKMMAWWGVQMKTLTDNTPSKLSELLLKGTNMGIIEGRRLLNNNPHVNSQIHTLLDDFVSMQENSAQILKDYL
jgi:hypothetical protein